MSIFEQQFEVLKQWYPTAAFQVRPDGRLIQVEMDVPPGWNKDRVKVTFIAPNGYPQARPDCFWTDNDLRLAGGGQPANASANHNGHGGPEQLLWFSYHASAWNPNKDSLLTYVNIIKQRLNQRR